MAVEEALNGFTGKLLGAQRRACEEIIPCLRAAVHAAARAGRASRSPLSPLLGGNTSSDGGACAALDQPRAQAVRWLAGAVERLARIAFRQQPMSRRAAARKAKRALGAVAAGGRKQPILADRWGLRRAPRDPTTMV